MAETLRDLTVKIKLDNAQFNSAMNQTKGTVDSASSSISSKLKGIATAVATGFAVKAVVGFGKECISAAANLEEMENKFNVVFANTGDAMTAWANDYADAIGRSSTEIRTAVSNQADLMIGMGMSEEVAGDLSKKYTELAYDLASFNNVNDATALEAMTKAMFGETEMAKQLGLNLSVTTMKNSEYVKSLGKNWDAMTQAEKAEAYYQEALKQSVNAIGDAERSSGSYTNQMKRLESAKTRLYEVIGTQLLPIFTPLVTMMGNVVTNASKIIEAFFGVYNSTGSLSEAFEAIGVDISGLQVIWEAMTTFLNDTYQTMIAPLIDGFKEMINDMAQKFADNSGKIESCFENVGSVISDIWTSVIQPVWDFFMDYIFTLWDIFNENIGNVLDLWDTVSQAIKSIWENLLKPVFEKVMEWVRKLFDKFNEYMPQIQRVVDEVFGMIKSAWETALKPAFEAIGSFLKNVLFPVFDAVFTYGIMPVVETVFQTIIKLWDNSLKPMFQGVIDFIGGVFTGDWKRAWQGVSDIFGGIWNGLKTIAKAPLNAIINMVNTLIGGLNKLKLPDWVPGIGGKGINIPKIPTLWKGSNYTLGGLTLVGEQGPELVNMPRGASVTPAHKTEQLLNTPNATPQQVSIVVQTMLDGKVLAETVTPYTDIVSGNRLNLSKRGVLV